MKRRTKVSAVAAANAVARGKGGLQVGQTRGLVSPVTAKTTTVTLRLSGPWHDLWERLRAAVPGVSDAELLRQGVALRMALAALDGKGKKPRATIQFHDERGAFITSDLETHVGINSTAES